MCSTSICRSYGLRTGTNIPPPANDIYATALGRTLILHLERYAESDGCVSKPGANEGEEMSRCSVTEDCTPARTLFQYSLRQSFSRATNGAASHRPSSE